MFSIVDNNPKQKMLNSLGSKKTMAFKQANSVSSIWTSVNGFTSSSIIRVPTRATLRSELGSRTGDTITNILYRNLFYLLLISHDKYDQNKEKRVLKNMFSKSPTNASVMLLLNRLSKV